MRFVQLVRHDDAHYDLTVIPEHAFRSDRFNVLLPIDVSAADALDAASSLAAYIRLTESGSVFVDKQQIRKALARFEAVRRFQERRVNIEHQVMGIDWAAASRQNQYIMAPNAEQVASGLLAKLDPLLHKCMVDGTAFYFATATTTYIWYPNERAIVSLDEDAPHYVCVHSTDTTVEQNKFDWAITMRTYLLGDETHWRRKANFHLERWPRGGEAAYAKK